MTFVELTSHRGPVTVNFNLVSHFLPISSGCTHIHFIDTGRWLEVTESYVDVVAIARAFGQ